MFIDAIRDVAQLTKALKLVKGGGEKALANYKGKVESVIGLVKDATQGGLERPLFSWRAHLSEYTKEMAGQDREKDWIDGEEKLRRGIVNQLMELYQVGSQAIPGSSGYSGFPPEV